MTVTIKDIAKVAKVSHTTVSRALNNSEFIKKETRDEILAIADELNYVANLNARSLVTKKSETIGLFFTTMNRGTSTSFMAEVMSAVSDSLDESYHIFMRGIDVYQDFNTIKKSRFDGIILMSQSESDDAFIKHVLKEKIPLIVLNRVTSLPATNIIADDIQGAELATAHLIEKGHKEIAIIEGVKNFDSTKRRKQGFLNALETAALPLQDAFCIEGDYSFESGYDAMTQLLSLSKRPSAIFASNDDMAIGAIKAVHEFGLMIPEDIAIIGFDDSPLAEYTTPSLSSIARPMEQMSIEGTKKLLEMIRAKEELENESTFFPTTLIKRKTT